MGTLKVIFFYEILSCTNSIVYARFEVFKSFLCVFMSVFRVFVRNELWVKLPVAIFFGTVDCRCRCTVESHFRSFILVTSDWFSALNSRKVNIGEICQPVLGMSVFLVKAGLAPWQLYDAIPCINFPFLT